MPSRRASGFTALSRGGNYSELWVAEVSTGACRKIQKADANQPHWSPHGHRIAYWTRARESENAEVWTIPAAGGAAVRVTADPAPDWNPVWSHDGRYLYFLSNRGGSPNLWRVPVDEASGEVLGEAEPVTTGESSSRDHLSLAREGGRIVYMVQAVHRNLQKIAFDPDAETVVAEPLWLTEGSTHRSWPAPSPDGRWLAYTQAGEDGERLYVRAESTEANRSS